MGIHIIGNFKNGGGPCGCVSCDSCLPILWSPIHVSLCGHLMATLRFPDSGSIDRGFSAWWCGSVYVQEEGLVWNFISWFSVVVLIILFHSVCFFVKFHIWKHFQMYGVTHKIFKHKLLKLVALVTRLATQPPNGGRANMYFYKIFYGQRINTVRY